ncbi:MAG: hypothetical protein MI717_09210 [Spirochaetales bacterium]|nr:hypothetical protein [Spirochaetales bacterium]
MNNREGLKKHISLCEDMILAENDRCEDILSNLGQRLFETQWGEDTAPRKSVQESIDRLLEHEESLRNLLADEEQRVALNEERKQLNLESRNLKNQEDPKAEVLGKVLWDMWKSQTLPDARIEESLQELIQAHRRLEHLKQAIKDDESRETSRFQGFWKKGKSLILAGKQRNATAAFDRLWMTAGRQVSDSFATNVFVGTVAEEASQIMDESVKERKKVKARLADIEREMKELETAMESLPGKGPLRRRKNWIEQELEQREYALDEAYRSFARDWLKKSENEKTVPSEAVKRLTEDWNSNQETVESLQERQMAARAHLDYSDTLRARERMAARVADAEHEMKMREASLQNLREELAATDRELLERKANLPPLMLENPSLSPEEDGKED